MASVSLTIGLVFYQGLHHVEDSYEKLAKVTMPNLNAVNDMFLHYRSVRFNLRTLGIPGLSKQQIDQAIKAMNDSVANYEKADKAYTDLTSQSGQHELYTKVNAQWFIFKEIAQRSMSYYNMGTPAAHEKFLKLLVEDLTVAATEYGKVATKLKDYHTAQGNQYVLQARDDASSVNRQVLIISIAGVLAGLFIGFLFSRSISNTIFSVAQTLVSNAEQVTSASNQIAASSEELSQTATEQASSLEETAASLEEITSMINQASGRVDATTASSLESQHQAEEGREAVVQMLHSMNEISVSNEAILAQVNDGNRQLTEISKVIREIGSKTKVINEIVFQTKLLSFNASVEAARAGEHGKGFAVVAEEVGNLAQMSGNAAKEISEMLDGSIAKVEGIVEETKTKVEALVYQGKQKVDKGVFVAKQCSSSLDKIVINVSKVSELSREILQANREQVMGITEINKAMAQLDMSTQQNAATSEESASSAEELSAQASSMKEVTDRLLDIIQGHNGSANYQQMNQHQHHFEGRSFPKADLASNVIHMKAQKRSFKRPQKLNSETTEDFFKKAAGDDVALIGEKESKDV
jgi:methyl-accepting chemotaxis protein